MRFRSYAIIIVACLTEVLIEALAILIAYNNRAVFSPEGMHTNLSLYYGTTALIIVGAFFAPIIAVIVSDLDRGHE